MKNPYHSYGQNLARAIHGVSQPDYVSMVAQDGVLRSGEGEPFQRELCKIAAAIYAETGGGKTVAGKLFEKLASADTPWCPQFSRFTDPVLTAIGRWSVDESTDEREKSASAAALLPIVASDRSGVPAALKLLVGLGAIGGAGAGSVAFMLGRSARQSSAESQQLLEKARAYKKLRREVDEDLANSGALEEDTAGAPSAGRTQRYSL
jgi:hypothetical protein